MKIVLNGETIARVQVKNGQIVNRLSRIPAQTYSRGWSEQQVARSGGSFPLADEKAVKLAIAKINKEVGFDALTDATSKIVNGRRLEKIRSELEDRINAALVEIQPRLAAMILGQTAGILEGGMGGYIPAYSALTANYIAKKKAIAAGKRRVRSKAKTANYLRRHPDLADRYFVYSGELIRHLKRTSSTMPRRVGKARVTFNSKVESKSSVMSQTRVRGERVNSDLDAQEYKMRIGSFRIEYFGRLSFHELNQIYSYKAGTRGVRDNALPYSLFPAPIAARLKGTDKAAPRPLILPTLAFYAQKKIPAVIQDYIGASTNIREVRRPGRAQTILYDRANPGRGRPR